MTFHLRELGAFSLCAVALHFAIRTSQYVSLNPNLFEPGLRERYEPYLPIVALHAGSSIVALLSGLPALSARVRHWSLKFHKRIGKIYFFSVVIGALTGAYMSLYAFGGGASKTGLMILSCLWFITALKAVQFARLKNIHAHKRWMQRNYALTLGAFSLRMELSILSRLELGYQTVYPIAVWSSWTLNLLLLETILRLRARQKGRGFEKSGY